MQRTDLDPSLAFTALWEQGALAELTATQGDALRRRLLAAWYAQDECRNLWDFTRGWLAARAAIRPEWGGRRCLLCGCPAWESLLSTATRKVWVHGYWTDDPIGDPHDVILAPEVPDEPSE